MKSVLISIQPEFVEKIFSGTKRIELRRRFTTDTSGLDFIYIYCTAPISAVVGRAVIDKVEQLSIDDIVSKRRKYTGIDDQRTRNYFEGLETGYAIWLSSVEKLKDHIGIDELADVGVKRPPQSYAYIPSQSISQRLGHEDSYRHEHLHTSRRRRRAAAEC
jgi:predicted transcriptional regulator